MSEQRGVPLLSGVQTVKSIRDTGYKSTDYAIAELIDNAVDARANNISLLIVEEPREGRERKTKKAVEIYVMDDGQGMSKERANLALSFGGSGNYDSRESIGRFGMGLPQASVSQCRRTEVWSWQGDQPDNAHRTVLDLDTIERSDSAELTVPWPTEPQDIGHSAPPSFILELFSELHSTEMRAGQPSSSGTIVRWSNLDRLRWVKAASVVTHTEFLLGRIYRRFLMSGEKRINIIIGERSQEGDIQITSKQPVRANDPMYLSVPASTLLQYWEKKDPKAEDQSDQSQWIKITDEAPFVQFQQVRNYELTLPSGEGTGRVTVKFSEARPEARPGRNAGAHTWLGKNAKDNRGISIIRHHREVLLEQTLVNEPVDRWWGVEIDFSPELDEIFGVTNNKQDAPYFSTALRYVIQNDLDPAEAREEALFDDDNPVSQLYVIAYDINRAISRIKQESKKKQQSHQRNTTSKAPQTSSVASAINQTLSKETPTQGEKEQQQRGISKDEVVQEIERKLQEKYGLSTDAAQVVSKQYREGINVHFLDAHQSQSPAFFWADEVFDDEHIFVNTDHPAYSRLIEPLRLSSEEIQQLPEVQAKVLLGRASDSMALLLQAFCRLELEVQGNSRAENYYQEVRENWGRRLREIVNHNAFIADELFDDDDE